ncbi:unnamed protein product [Trichobilharzia szidati]|nr:unnamed protein product [Trichobilharzia szidati]
MRHLSNLRLTCGKSQTLYATPKVRTMFTDAFSCISKNSLDIVTLVYSLLSGVTIAVSHVVSTQRYASTHILLTEVEILRALFVYSYLIDLKRGVGYASEILSMIVYWISVSWGNGGLCHTIWKTMMLILMNGRMSPNLHERKSPRSSPKKNVKTSQTSRSDVQKSSTETEINNDQNSDALCLDSSTSNTDEDWEVLNEENLYVDCQGLLEDDILTPNSVIHLVDLESEKPLMQVGPAVFEGHYEDVVGTYLLFENCKSPLDSTLFTESGTATFSSRKVNEQTQNTANYVTKCSKSLLFQRIFLKTKAE